MVKFFKIILNYALFQTTTCIQLQIGYIFVTIPVFDSEDQQVCKGAIQPADRPPEKSYTPYVNGNSQIKNEYQLS